MTVPGQPRQLLRPWLTDQINSGLYPGLEWIDREKQIFKIPWKHFGRPGVDEQRDGLLFKNYAIHTNKYKEGEAADISAMKTRFRCAMHKHAEIEEVHALNQVEGDNPYKVYRFKPNPNSSTADLNVSSPICLSPMSNPVLASPAPSFRDLTLEEIEGQLKQETESAMVDTRGSGHYYGIKEEPDMSLLKTATVNNYFADQFPAELMDPDLIQSMDATDAGILDSILGDSSFGSSAYGASNSSVLPTQNTSMHSDGAAAASNSSASSLVELLHVKLYYADQEVKDKLVQNINGFRVAFNPPPPLPDDVLKDETSAVVMQVYGPLNADQVYYPPSSDSRTAPILDIIRRGIVIQTSNGEIRATRLCRARIFYSSSATLNTDLKELKRQETTKVFDYFNEFLPALQRYILGQGSAPSYEVFFSVGQKWSAELPLKNNFVHFSVTHCLAQQYSRQVHEQKVDNILYSDPNMLDVIANQIEDLSLSAALTKGIGSASSSVN